MNKSVAIPLIQAGTVTDVKSPALNLNENCTVNIIRGGRRSDQSALLANVLGGSATFDKRVDNIDSKTIPDCVGYAAKHVFGVNIPGCATPGKVFVGQRKDPFAVNLGVIFDLINAPRSVVTNPSLMNAGMDDLADKNVTTLALEAPAARPVGASPVIGGWTTAGRRRACVKASA